LNNIVTVAIKWAINNLMIEYTLKMSKLCKINLIYLPNWRFDK